MVNKTDYYIHDTISSYNTLGGKYQTTHRLNLGFYMPFLEEFIRQLRGKKILEIGCAEGLLAQIFKSKGLEYTGIDASEKSIEEAKKKNPSCNFFVMDFHEIKLPDNSFDGIWSTETLLHSTKQKFPDVLLQLSKLLKNNAVCFISMQEMEPIQEDERGVLEEGVITKVRQGKLIKRYMAFYQEEELRNILEGVGFKVTKMIKKKKKGLRWLCVIFEKR